LNFDHSTASRPAGKIITQQGAAHLRNVVRCG
jgi:hypothetical protein